LLGKQGSATYAGTPWQARQNRTHNVAEPTKARQFFIHGVTVHGRTFRPSDWAERLCGVMSPYRPGGIATGRDAFIGYSPYVRPETIGGVKCVVVDERLKDVELMAFNFVMNFARDNELPVTEGCVLPEAPKQIAAAVADDKRQ
jgi:hypothetical protein